VRIKFDTLLTDYRREQWVSLKITIADSSTQSRELHNLQSLAEISRGSLHYQFIVHLLDHFSHQGPNGIHGCLVFELLGPTVDAVTGDVYQGGDVLDPETILRMSQQLLQAVAFMHEVGYAHGGMRCGSCT
jgi:serine/threonine-protein kinase SRPK3